MTATPDSSSNVPKGRSVKRDSGKHPLSVRIDSTITDQIDAEAKRAGVDRSHIVRAALLAYFNPNARPKDPVLTCIHEVQQVRRCVLKSMALLMTELKFTAEQQRKLLDPLAAGLTDRTP